MTWDWDFGPICLAGKVYALFLHVGNFAAFCVEAEIYGSEVLLYAKVPIKSNYLTDSIR